MALLQSLVTYLDAELRRSEIPDYEGALNGLQLANSGSVTRVAAAVDFSANSIAGAISEDADLLLVHHGMFWRGAHPIVGIAYDRLRVAIAAGLAVYASHIPLDIHPVHGNNVLLAEALGLEPKGGFGRFRDIEVGVSGTVDCPTATLLERVEKYSAEYGTVVTATPFPAKRRTKHWAIVTGAGATSATITEAHERGVDTLIVGEGTHHTAVEAIETGLVVVYAGHYATETLGVRSLATHLESRFDVSSVFVNVPTGL